MYAAARKTRERDRTERESTVIDRPLVIELGGISADEGVAFSRAAGIVVEAARERSSALVLAYPRGVA